MCIGTRFIKVIYLVQCFDRLFHCCKTGTVKCVVRELRQIAAIHALQFGAAYNKQSAIENIARQSTEHQLTFFSEYNLRLTAFSHYRCGRQIYYVEIEPAILRYFRFDKCYN